MRLWRDGKYDFDCHYQSFSFVFFLSHENRIVECFFFCYLGKWEFKKYMCGTFPFTAVQVNPVMWFYISQLWFEYLTIMILISHDYDFIYHNYDFISDLWFYLNYDFYLYHNYVFISHNYDFNISWLWFYISQLCFFYISQLWFYVSHFF